MEVMTENEKTVQLAKKKKPPVALPQIYAAGLWRNNPILIMLLGCCPALAVTGSAVNGFGMGIATLFVLTMSNVVISAFRKFIPDSMRIPAFIVLIATFVTVVDLLMQAYTPVLSKSLGIFIPLIVVNCIILGRAEAFAYKNTVFHSINDGLAMGLGFTMMLTIMGVVREIFGAGTVFGQVLLGEQYNPVLIMILPPGAFLTMGYLVAFSNYLNKKKAR